MTWIFLKKYTAIVTISAISFVLLVLLLTWHHFWIYPESVGTISDLSYPYVLNVEPKLATTGGSVDISYSFLDNRTTPSAFEILVFDALGRRTPYPVSNMSGALKYPDHSDGSKLSWGNYTVLLVSRANNQSISALNFQLVPFPYFTSLYNFALGLGLTITVTTIIAILTAIYEFLSRKHTERNTKLQEKSDWIITNAKYYMDLAYASKKICDCFTIKENSQGQMPNDSRNKVEFELEYNQESDNEFDCLMDSNSIVFYHIVEFYRAYSKFKENVSFYYFDNVFSEDFLNHLERKIRREYIRLQLLGSINRCTKIMVDDNNKLLEVMTNQIDGCLEKFKCSRLYKYHLLYALILIVSVNDGSLITYTNPSQVKKTLRHWIDDELVDWPQNDGMMKLQEILNEINCEFYDKEKFYQPNLEYNNILKDYGFLRYKKYWRGYKIGLSFLAGVAVLVILLLLGIT